MAILFTPSQRVWSTAGAPVAGGKLRVYDAGTTLLSATYSDEAMLVSLTNPVVADSNGWLPAIFAADNTYDLQALDASSVAIAGQQWNDWSTIGGSSVNTLERTLSGARFKVRGGDIGDGSIGALIEAGSPSPDDTGGYMRHGGWAGTQLDKGITDALVWDFVQTKSLKEGGKRISSAVYTEATAFSAAATVNIALANTPSGTRAWEINIWDLVNSAGSVQIRARLAYDSVPTIKSGASDYGYNVNHALSTGSADSYDDAETYMVLLPAGIHTATSPGMLRLRLITPNSGNGDTLILGEGGFYDASGPCIAHIHGRGRGNYGRATYLQLYPGSGTITGSYMLRALRGYGE